MLANIAAPISLLEECAALGQGHVALAHLIEKSEDYKRFYLKMSRRGDWVTVDNSVVEEGSPCDLTRLLAAADAVEATEIILPDVIGDGAATVELVEEALTVLDGTVHSPEMKMAVCHGKTWDDFEQCYVKLSCMPYVNTIGLSMFLDETLGRGAREEICLRLDAAPRESPYPMGLPHHLLGCYHDLREFEALKHLPWIRSADTGVPIRLGIEGYVHPRTEMGPPPPVTHRDFDFFGDYEMRLAIRRNLEIYGAYCGDQAVLSALEAQG